MCEISTEDKIKEISIFQPDWFKKVYFLGLAETFEQYMFAPDQLKTNHLIFLKSHNEIYTFIFTTEYADLQFDKIAQNQDVSFFKLNSIEDFQMLMNNEKLVKFYIPYNVQAIEKKQEYGQTVLGPCRITTSEEMIKKSIYSSYFSLIEDEVKECNMEHFQDFIKNNFSLEKIINFKGENEDIIDINNKEIERD